MGNEFVAFCVPADRFHPSRDENEPVFMLTKHKTRLDVSAAGGSRGVS